MFLSSLKSSEGCGCFFELKNLGGPLVVDGLKSAEAEFRPPLFAVFI